MRRLLLLIALSLSVNGCFLFHTYEASYVVGFDEAEPADEYVTVQLGPVDRGSLDLTVYNKSTTAVSIIWDQCTLVDDAGVTHRLIHNGVKLIEKEKAMVPTIVPPGAKHVDSVIPAANAIWARGGGWVIKKGYFPDIKYKSRIKSNLEGANKAAVGRKFKFFFTYSVDGKLVNKTYSLKVTDVIIN